MTPQQNDSAVVEDFRKERNLEKIEELADLLADSAHPEAAKALLERLVDDRIRDDADLENAICGALVEHRVMIKHGNLNYTFVEREKMPEVLAKYVYEEVRPYFPVRYFRR